MASDADLEKARAALYVISPREFYEVPGKADVVYELRDYSRDPKNDAEKARTDLPFLFKPFEVGQKPPPSKGREQLYGREPTIHEYLDWTVTANSTLDSLDFAGFRVLTLWPRYRPTWPSPFCGDVSESLDRSSPCLGGPKEPIPLLMPHNRPISATTIRCGPDYIEVPFFATKPSARGKGYGKALLYAIEDICRFLGLSKILLCSTDDAVTISTWQHLGFRHTMAEELPEWNIAPTELVHMTNTVQMVKMVGEVPQWKSLRIRHEGFDQRIYYISSTTKSPVVNKKRKEKQLENTEQSNKIPSRLDSKNEDTLMMVDSSSNGLLCPTMAKGGRREGSSKFESFMDVDSTARDTSECDRNNITDNSLQQQQRQSNTVIHSTAGDLCVAPIE